MGAGCARGTCAVPSVAAGGSLPGGAQGCFHFCPLPLPLAPPPPPPCKGVSVWEGEGVWSPTCWFQA